MSRYVATEIEERVLADPELQQILNYHHGWWRFFWRWHNKNQGVIWPDWKTVWAHRQYCEDSWDKIGFGVTLWRLSFGFDCSSKEKTRTRWVKYFSDAVLARQIEAQAEQRKWPGVVYEDILDADEVVE